MCCYFTAKTQQHMCCMYQKYDESEQTRVQNFLNPKYNKFVIITVVQSRISVYTG